MWRDGPPFFLFFFSFMVKMGIFTDLWTSCVYTHFLHNSYLRRVCCVRNSRIGNVFTKLDYRNHFVLSQSIDLIASLCCRIKCETTDWACGINQWNHTNSSNGTHQLINHIILLFCVVISIAISSFFLPLPPSPSSPSPSRHSPQPPQLQYIRI